MTSAATRHYEYYPQYCFHLSPTINKWCPLRASDIQELQQHPGFAGQVDIFFHLNHPIRWVRIVGVVVAIDEYHGRRIYTVDDSTGLCMECSVTIPTKMDADLTKAVKPSGPSAAIAVTSPDPYSEIDVGLVVEVKGSLKLFREQKQMKVEKLQSIPSTAHEVQFWNKIRTFRTEVLSRPWVLERKVVRRLKREQEADADVREKHKLKKKKKRGYDEEGRHHHVKHSPHTSALKKTYRPSKLSSVMTHTEGQYDALGL